MSLLYVDKFVIHTIYQILYNTTLFVAQPSFPTVLTSTMLLIKHFILAFKRAHHQTLEKCILSHTEATLCIVSSSVYIQFRNSMFSFQELFFQKQIYVYISIIKTEIKVDSMPLHSHWTFLAFPFAMNVYLTYRFALTVTG